MRKIKALITKIKSGLTLKTYQQPLLVTISVLLILNLLVLVVGSIAALVIDAGMDNRFFGGSFFKAFAQALLWMITPNSITKFSVESDFRMMILAAVVIAIEMVLFSGSIVATLTTAVKSFIDKKSNASGTIDVEDHFVILNWNSKVPEMIFNLLKKDYGGSIVILSDKGKEYIQGEVNAIISAAGENNKKRKIKLIVKEGNPLLHHNLKDVSIEKAAHICIMVREDMQDAPDDNILNSDLLSLKTVLALGNFDINPNCNIVVEVEEDKVCAQIGNLSKTIDNLKNKTIIPISFTQKIGQIIAQTLVNPVMSGIYLDLFSYDGCEFYSCEYDGGVDEFMRSHTSAIPIKKYDRIFVLADDEAEIKKTRGKDAPAARPLQFHDNKSETRCTLFVIGSNKKSPFIIESLKRMIGNSVGFDMRTYHKNDVQALIDDIRVTDGEKRVLVLSDDTVNAESYDANVFVSLIALASAFPARENLSFITELLDSRNLQSIKDFDVHNAIISNKMMSLLITNIALNRDSAQFFENLILLDDADGGDCFDICTAKASDILDGEIGFSSRAEAIRSFYESSDRRYMLLGRRVGRKREYFCTDQDSQPVTIREDDELIYIKY